MAKPDGIIAEHGSCVDPRDEDGKPEVGGSPLDWILHPIEFFGRRSRHEAGERPARVPGAAVKPGDSEGKG